MRKRNEPILRPEYSLFVTNMRRETTGPAAALKLTLETPDVLPNGKDVAILGCTCVDEQGREVPDACPTVTVSAFGSGTVYSTGSDITDHSSLLLSRRHMRAGNMGIAVKMNDKKQPLKVVAQADGLKSAVLIKEF